LKYKAPYTSIATDMCNIIVSYIFVSILHIFRILVREYIYISFGINNKKPTISSGFIN